MPAVSVLFALSCLLSSASAQSFDAASVRPSTHIVDVDLAPAIAARMPSMGTMHGGPGTDDPGRIVYTSVSLTQLLTTAYGLKLRQVSGPDWIDTRTYDIEATLPPATTPPQFQAMLQTLLKERFALRVHSEKKDAADSAYELVLAKNGPKLKRAADPATPPKATEARPGGRRVVTFRAYSLTDFAKWLGIPLANIASRASGSETYSAAHVLDHTALTGPYDFTLEFAGSPGPGGAVRPLPADKDVGGVSLFVAIERQLGLKLEQTKVPLEILVVDHAEPVPTEN